MKPVVLITRNIPFDINKNLEPYFQIKVIEKEFNGENLADFKEEKIFALFTFVIDKVSEEIINQLPKSLQVISNCAVGYNNIDIAACKKNNITVTNTPGVLTDATADLTFALLLNISRRVMEGHNLILADKFTGWLPDMLLGSELSGKTLGIIGLGRIGKAVANRAKAFNMNIIYHNRSKRDVVIDEAEKIYFKELDDLLKEADFVSIHISFSEVSRHLITKKELDLMKKTAFLINTSRGECIKESDLATALADKTIAGAALDVFEFEPRVTEELKKLSNVVLTPHIGSATFETRQKMADIASQNIVNSFTGEGIVYKVEC
jgi:glyoxylate reductase